MCTMLVVLFYLHQQKKNYRMMGAFTRKSLVKVKSKRKRKKIWALMGQTAFHSEIRDPETTILSFPS